MPDIIPSVSEKCTGIRNESNTVSKERCWMKADAGKIRISSVTIAYGFKYRHREKTRMKPESDGTITEQLPINWKKVCTLLIGPVKWLVRWYRIMITAISPYSWKFPLPVPTARTTRLNAFSTCIRMRRFPIPSLVTGVGNMPKNWTPKKQPKMLPTATSEMNMHVTPNAIIMPTSLL